MDANWTALLRTQPCSPEDAAFREWLNSFPKERRFSPAGQFWLLAVLVAGEVHRVIATSNDWSLGLCSFEFVYSFDGITFLFTEQTW